jgi:voltage-gated potassium channel Kch
MSSTDPSTQEENKTFGALLRDTRGKSPGEIFYDEPEHVKLFAALLICAARLTFRSLFVVLPDKLGRMALPYYLALVPGALVVSAKGQSFVPFIVLAYLLYETVSWTLFDTFVLFRAYTFRTGREFRMFLWVVYNFLLLASAYAIFFWRSGKVVDNCGHPLSGFTASIYYSVMTLTTVGYGDFHPARDAALVQLVVSSEPLVGIMLLVVYLGLLVGGLGGRFKTPVRPDWTQGGTK